MQIAEAQRIIRETYGAADAARGVHETFGWFVEEVGELSRAIRREGRDEQVEEFTDVLAWLVTLAEMQGIDLDAEMQRRYGAGCPKCAASPCTCAH